MVNITYEDIGKLQQGSLWDFCDKILYDMCKNHLSHCKQDVIIGKLLLIGRSYSAAIERNIQTEVKSDDCYLKVAETLLREQHKLDEQIQKLKSYNQITRETLPQIINIHKYLLELIRETTGHENRVFVSKYLHFHVPNMFYIYDSQANTKINNYVSVDKNIKNELLLLEPQGDNEYLKFVAKAFSFNIKINNEFSTWLTPRQIDNLLLGY